MESKAYAMQYGGASSSDEECEEVRKNYMLPKKKHEVRIGKLLIKSTQYEIGQQYQALSIPSIQGGPNSTLP